MTSSKTRAAAGLAMLWWTLATLAACARDTVRDAPGSTSGGDSAGGVAPGPVGATTAAGPRDTAESPQGVWTPAVAEEAMRSRGLAFVRERAAVRRVGLGVPGTRYHVGPATVELYIFADPVARGRSTDALDPGRVAPEMPVRPTLLTDGNMAALVFSTDAALTQRLRGALTRGAETGVLR